jgi:hypothetical protein
MRRAPVVLVPLLACASAAAQGGDWPYSMDYGPCLMTTFEAGGRSGDTMKAVVVPLAGATVAFDTELLRVSAAWTDGWLRLRGTAYDGAHGPMVRLRGRKFLETANAPGFAHDGSFADPRAIPHGPLPREWGRYRGWWLHGDQVVLGYSLGNMAVREVFGTEADGKLFTRTMEFGPSTAEHSLVLADLPDAAQLVAAGGAGQPLVLQWPAPSPGVVELDAAVTGWQQLAMGGPSAADYLDASSNTGATIAFVPGFARAQGRAKPATGEDPLAARLLPVLADGRGATKEGDPEAAVWFDKHKVGGRDSDRGRYLIDLQRVVEVSRVSTFSWHRDGRSVQQYELFGSAVDAPVADARDPAAAGWTLLASVDSSSLGDGDRHGVSIARPEGLGRFRHLLMVVRNGGACFSEVDVYADKFRASIDAKGRANRQLTCALRGDAGARLWAGDGRLLLKLPPHQATVRVQVVMHADIVAPDASLQAEMVAARPVAPLPSRPGAPRWGAAIATRGELGEEKGPFAVDTVAIPFDNRFGSRMRTAAFDFFRDGRAAVSTWNGDVWIVSGLSGDFGALQWRRFATGLFDPLGLRIVDDVIYVHGRDGITRLHDENGDGEADFYECFNNDVYITRGFHEFAFDLQTDAAGNFYFSKGAPVNPGGRGFMPIVPHHGTILKLSKDGTQLETFATGLRAPNGIGVSPTGVVTSGDNEGTYMPRCRLNYMETAGYYAGVKDTAQRSPAPDQPDLPLCWMPMEVDNSSGGQVWVTGKGWPDLQERMLHLSYGTCSTYLVLEERVAGRIQGGVVRLPANFTSSCMRGRFHPIDGQLYVLGLQGWQTSAAKEGGFHRVRRTAAPLGLPIALRTCERGVYLGFAEPLDAETAADPDSYGVEIWNYQYSPNYGSPELSVLHPERKVEQGKPNRDPLKVRSASLSSDGRTVFLAIDGMQPVHQMKITWNIDSKDGRSLKGELHNSIHALAADPGFPEVR